MTEQDKFGQSDDDVASLLFRLKHRPGMVGYECYSFGDVAQAVRAAVAAERERREYLEQVLREIGDFAHDHSTGPAVPDVLWEVRSMAYGA